MATSQSNGLPEWDFSPHYSGIEDSKLNSTLNSAFNQAKEFNTEYKGKIVTLSDSAIKEMLQKVEKLMEMVYPISMYASLLTSKYSQNTEYSSFQSKIQEKTTKVFNELVFLSLEINELEDEKFKSMLSSSELENYVHYLTDTRKFKEYQLSEKEEQMIITKNQYGRNGFQKLYSELVASWEFDFEVDGEVKKLSGPQLRAMRMNQNPDVRRRAMKTFFSKYEENKLVITSIFNNLYKDYSLENQKRGYPAPITRRNMNNEIDDETVRVLEEATTASYPRLVHRYYKMKKEIIGIDRLELADIYAPLPTVDKKYSWDDAVDLVTKAFADFDEQFKQIFLDMLANKRIDAPPLPGKRGGAFCAGATPDDPLSWVFLNYQENINDISTLAHEMGHAIHHTLGAEVQTTMNFGISLVTAEVASVFCEMILTDYILNKVELTRDEKISFLSATLESNFATSHRQNMFARFESMAHELSKEKLLSTEEYCDIYQSELEKMFGDAVEITPEFRWEWSTIPHFVQVFHYVYAYNMSNLLVLALYGLYLERGKEFIPQFKKLLAVRKAKTPEDMMTAIGIDIKDPEFWDRGLNYLEGMVDQLEELLKQ